MWANLRVFVIASISFCFRVNPDSYNTKSILWWHKTCTLVSTHTADENLLDENGKNHFVTHMKKNLQKCLHSFFLYDFFKLCTCSTSLWPAIMVFVSQNHQAVKSASVPKAPLCGSYLKNSGSKLRFIF